MDLLTKKRLDWFGGNTDALAMYELFIELSHTWDDLVDKDKAVPAEKINHAFMVALFHLQANPFYTFIQPAILPMWLMVGSAYETANFFEQNKDAHGIEIAHSLRYAAGHILAYAVIVCNGYDKARQYLPELWKDVFFERFDAYKAGLEQ